MKTIILLGCLVSTNAFALDFDKEYANFSKDFARLKEIKLAKLEPMTKPEAPIISTVEVKDAVVLPSKNTQDNTLQQVDPKSPDRLGYGLTDPAMKKHVTSLYQKPNTVVYSLTLE